MPGDVPYAPFSVYFHTCLRAFSSTYLMRGCIPRSRFSDSYGCPVCLCCWRRAWLRCSFSYGPLQWTLTSIIGGLSLALVSWLHRCVYSFKLCLRHFMMLSTSRLRTHSIAARPGPGPVSVGEAVSVSTFSFFTLALLPPPSPSPSHRQYFFFQ